MKKPNFIILMTDGMRADFANDEKVTPYTHAFFNKHGGYKFSNAYTTTTWTLASFMSVLTGLLPVNNGLDNITESNRTKILAQDEYFFKASNITDDEIIMAMLNKQGYHTQYFGQKLMYRFATKTLFHLFKKILFFDFFFFQMDKIEKSVIKEPFFYFIYGDDGGHHPYGRFTRTNHSAWNAEKARCGLITDNLVRHNPKRFTRKVLYDLLKDQGLQYDEKLKDFWKWFVDTGLYKNTFVFYLSDHGECLNEHDWTGHVYNAYEPIVHIPLMMYVPEMYGKISEFIEIKDLVSSVDIVPTILGTAKYGDGINLTRRTGEERVIFFDYKRSGRPVKDAIYKPKNPDVRVLIHGLRYKNQKFIVTQTYDGNRYLELFDIDKDKDEQNNLISKASDEQINRYFSWLEEAGYKDINAWRKNK